MTLYSRNTLNKNDYTYNYENHINSEKEPIADEKLLPEYVILQPDLLKTLPLYQKNTLCLMHFARRLSLGGQKKATQKTIIYSKQAIDLIFSNMEKYLQNDNEENKQMLYASNIAGKAINITTITAPHAMSYKLTTLYGLPHGHAVAICFPKVWRQMKNYDHIAKALGRQNHEDAILFFEAMLQKLEIFPPSKRTGS